MAELRDFVTPHGRKYRAPADSTPEERRQIDAILDAEEPPAKGTIRTGAERAATEAVRIGTAAVKRLQEPSKPVRLGETLERAGQAAVTGTALGEPPPEGFLFEPFTRFAREEFLPVTGATAGAVAGAAFPVLGPLTPVAGAFLGGTGGAAAAQKAGLQPRATSPFLQGAFLAGGEVIGRGIVGGGRAIGRALSLRPAPDVVKRMAAMEATGVTPKPSDVAAGRFPSVMERGLQQTLTGGEVITGRVAQQAERIKTFAQEEFLARVGPASAGEAVTTGTAAHAAIKRTLERTDQLEDQLFARLTTAAQTARIEVDLGPDAVSAARAIAQELKGRELTRREGGISIPRILTIANRILARGQTRQVPTGIVDAAGKPIMRTEVVTAPTITFAEAREWSKAYGQAIERGELISRLPKGEMKAFYGSLLTDMERAVERAGRPDIQNLWTSAKQFAERRRALFRDSDVADILKVDPEDVLRRIDVLGGPSAVQRAKDAILGTVVPGHTPTAEDRQAWNFVRRHLIEGFLRDATQEVRGLPMPIINGARLERKLRAVGEETLREFLEPHERQALQNIVTVAKTIQAGERIASVGFTSVTPQGTSLQGSVVLGGELGAQALGLPSGVGAITTFFFAPPLLAKAITSEGLAQAIASPAWATAAKAAVTGAKVGREATLLLSRIGSAVLERDISPLLEVGRPQKAAPQTIVRVPITGQERPPKTIGQARAEPFERHIQATRRQMQDALAPFLGRKIVEKMTDSALADFYADELRKGRITPPPQPRR